MDSWTTFPDLFEEFPTDQQPQPYPFENPFPQEFRSENGLTSHDFTDICPTDNNLFEPPHPLSISQEPLLLMPQDTGTSCVDDAQLTAATVLPPKRRKKKAPTLRAKDWEPYKARILELHDAQKLPLAKVKEMIEEEFGFTAELRQYRTRISQWGKDKKIKKLEMAAVVRKRQQRKLVEINKGQQIFSIRGRDVDPHKIDRWMVRNEVSQTSLYAPSPTASTPSAVLCRTISEHGSVALSPARSTRSVNFSPKSAISITSSPMVASPVPLVPCIGYPQNSVFSMENHAHVYQPFSATSSVFKTPISDAILHDQLLRLYGQDEEEGAREALSVAEKSFGAYHPQTLGLRIKLGGILIEQGRYSHAEEVALRAVKDCGKYVNSLAITLDALQLLGEVLGLQGSCRPAQQLQKLLLELRKAKLGEEDPSTVRSMIEVSWGYVENGNLGDAQDLCTQALKLSKKIFGEWHLNTMRATNLLVYTYSEQGRLDEAERLGEQMLKTAIAVLGEGHIGTHSSTSSLAFVYSKQGRSNEAGKLLRQALELSECLLWGDHPVTITDRRNLAAEYIRQGRLEEAQELAEQALMASERVFGKKHSKTSESMALLIEIYEDQGQIAKAEELEQQMQGEEGQETERQDEGMFWTFPFPTLRPAGFEE